LFFSRLPLSFRRQGRQNFHGLQRRGQLTELLFIDGFKEGEGGILIRNAGGDYF
jgi:hypothetical protein